MSRSISNVLAFVGLVLSFGACQPKSENTRVVELQLNPADPHSFANPEHARAQHLDLVLTADFEQEILRGTATWTVEAKEAGQVIFDSRDLDIEQVWTGADTASLDLAQFQLGQVDFLFGQGVSVNVPAGKSFVRFTYSTSPQAAALQWLSPAQTGTSKPFLYSQGQAILTRSWIPIQDGPGNRVSYSVRLRVPAELMAVMSAEGNPRQLDGQGEYQFSMPKAVPPYLIALAVGDLRFEPIGSNTGVYAIPATAKFASREFAEVDSMLAVAERLYGPYAWGRYDILVLPASFPFGGMENPMLTFATPTVLVGDSSLTSLIAHELAHSWSGNLVTNASWADFWLNEGFTTYIERRIIEELRGRDYAEMLLALGKQDLEHDFADLKPADQHLRLDLSGRDPDDGMTNVAYEKGSLMLQALEEKVGRERLDNFLRQYFEHFKFQSIDTDEFLAYAQDSLLTPSGKTFPFEAWIDASGLPEDFAETLEAKLLREVDVLIARFDEGEIFPKSQTLKWSSNEWVYFLRGISRNVDSYRYKQLDDTYNLSASTNSEIAATWFEAAIRNGYASEILPSLEAFLKRVGRRKYVLPIYRAMKERGMAAQAKAIYAKARPGYHAVTQGSVDGLW